MKVEELTSRQLINYNKYLHEFLGWCSVNNIIVHNMDSVCECLMMRYENPRPCYVGGIIEKLKTMVKYDSLYPEDIDTNYRQRILNLQGSSTVSHDKFIIRYGKVEGEKRFKEYQDYRRKINSFEYKSEKFGMTRDDFDNYNKNRASTRENFIKRYGEEEGSKKWNDYVNVQTYAGSSEQYFIDKYGDEKGKEKWKDVCMRKGHTVESYMTRLSCTEEEAIIKLDEYYATQSTKGYSKDSQMLFDDICNAIDLSNYTVYYAKRNKEFGKYDSVNKRYYKYDFVIPELQICIEYNGDHYHGNPHLYQTGDKLKMRGMQEVLVDDVWKYDKRKREVIEECNYKMLVIWEEDFNNDRQKVIQECVKFIQNAM